MMMKLALTVITISFFISDCYQFEENQDYSIENSAESESREVYTNNLEDDKAGDSKIVTTPEPTEKPHFKIACFKNETEKQSGEIDENNNDAPADKIENIDSGDISSEIADNVVDVQKMRSYEATSVKITTEATVHPMPPRYMEDCKERQYHSPTKSGEDKCTSTLMNYPFSVSIQRKGSHYASGALLGKRWILTAAGDFYHVRESLKPFRARLGSVDCKRGGKLIPLTKIEIHPLYEYGSPAFDVALLRLAHLVNYTDYIKPIQLSIETAPVNNAKFLTTYWPRLIINGKILPPTAKERIKQNSMRVSTQRLIPWDKCSEYTNSDNVTLNEATLCLKPVITHHGTCRPDSGAPIIAQDGLWGITSGWISADCQNRPSATLFNRLSTPEISTWLNRQLLAT